MSAPRGLPLVVAEHRDLGRGIAGYVFLLNLGGEGTIAFLDD